MLLFLILIVIQTAFYLCYLCYLWELYSILVLMDLCIKTEFIYEDGLNQYCFNPCFNGSMYKTLLFAWLKQSSHVSILVLMDLCIKTSTVGLFHNDSCFCFNPCFNGSMYKNLTGGGKNSTVGFVSILVLMDLCIKTGLKQDKLTLYRGFNPCFNGSMYKNIL